MLSRQITTQRCYCRCNLFSVILTVLAKIFVIVLAKIFVIWRKEFISQKPPKITLAFIRFESLFNLDTFTEE